MTTPQGVILFSPKFEGSVAAWNFICDRSNGRDCAVPELNAAQIQYARQAGYLTIDEVIYDN